MTLIGFLLLGLSMLVRPCDDASCAKQTLRFNLMAAASVALIVGAFAEWLSDGGGLWVAFFALHTLMFLLIVAAEVLRRRTLAPATDDTGRTSQ